MAKKKVHPFSVRLIQQMEESSVNAAQLARELEVAEATVHNWRQGNTLPNVGHIPQICLILKCDLQWLVTGTASSTLQDIEDQNENFATLILPVLGEDRMHQFSMFQGNDIEQKNLFIHLLRTPEMEPEVKRGTVMLTQKIPIKTMPDGFLAVSEWSQGSFRLGTYYQLDKSKASLQFSNKKFPAVELKITARQTIYKVLHYYIDMPGWRDD